MTETMTKNDTIQAVIEKLESIFTVFNEHIFNGQLEKPIIIVAPDTMRGSYGWCSSKKIWKGDEEQEFYEINLCAEYLTRPFEETTETLLHEMIHLKNMMDGVKDTSRSGKYHNRKFRDTAERYGLEVEQDSKYGFSRTKYSEKTLAWLNAEFPEENAFPLYRMKFLEPPKKSNTKKYVCPVCGAIVRATKEVHVKCEDCDESMVLED